MPDNPVAMLSDCTRCRILLPKPFAAQVRKPDGGELEPAGAAFPDHHFVVFKAGEGRKITATTTKFGLGSDEVLIIITNDPIPPREP